MAVGVFPGSFNPLTIAHLAVAEAAREQCALEQVDLALSVDTLGKQPDDLADLAHRQAALLDAAASRAWLGVVVTGARLLVDMAEGYDVLVVGADKWAQLHDPAWYGSTEARDAALARLPRRIAVAPRPPHPLPRPGTHGAVVLQLHPDHHRVSSSAVRAGRREWMATEAAAIDARHGVWATPRSEPGGGSRCDQSE
ncbi:MAG: hypothetical protein IPM45_00410 [Acidimicrobiales bacterium]|nr:hypothetical protein [Acidimicrobiales bacterium]